MNWSDNVNEWLMALPPSSASLIAALVAFLGVIISLSINRSLRRLELEDALKRHKDQIDHALQLHREKLDAEAEKHRADSERDLKLHRDKIEADFRKDDTSRKMQLRREVFLESSTALTKLVFWLQEVPNAGVLFNPTATEVREFATAMAKLNTIGNERTIHSSLEILTRWTKVLHAAIDLRFNNDPDSGFEKAMKEFGDAATELNLAVRSELDLAVNEGWFRGEMLAFSASLRGINKAWLAKVHQHTGTDALPSTTQDGDA